VWSALRACERLGVLERDREVLDAVPPALAA